MISNMFLIQFSIHEKVSKMTSLVSFIVFFGAAGTAGLNFVYVLFPKMFVNKNIYLLLLYIFII